ncbi:hypothetical protein NC652_033395 [Populus alba x Populus x berolinensis]|nr:hypothetical protein NC652_033395 [Populus alba x Populus x berolinensis]
MEVTDRFSRPQLRTEVKRTAGHLLQSNKLLQVEISMPPGILIRYCSGWHHRDAMDMAEEAEKENMKAACDWDVPSPSFSKNSADASEGEADDPMICMSVLEQGIYWRRVSPSILYT